MAKITSSKLSDRIYKVCKLINHYLAEKNWTPAQLSRFSTISKSTISRLTTFVFSKKAYCPTVDTLVAIAFALKLDSEKTKELIYTVYPRYRVYVMASENNWDIERINEELYNRGLPLLGQKHN